MTTPHEAQALMQLAASIKDALPDSNIRYEGYIGAVQVNRQQDGPSSVELTFLQREWWGAADRHSHWCLNINNYLCEEDIVADGVEGIDYYGPALDAPIAEVAQWAVEQIKRVDRVDWRKIRPSYREPLTQ